MRVFLDVEDVGATKRATTRSATNVRNSEGCFDVAMIMRVHNVEELYKVNECNTRVMGTVVMYIYKRSFILA